MGLNYKQDMQIDETALDVEWLDQPYLLIRYTKKLAKAKREVDRLKEVLDLVKAELDKEIRNDEKIAEQYPKVTEAVVTNEILMHDKYKLAMAEIIDAKYDVAVIQGAVNAVDQRKNALENLVKLLGQQYFAGPNVPRDFTEEVQKKRKKQESNKSVNIKTKKQKNGKR